MPLVTRWPGGTLIIDLSDDPLEPDTFARVAAELAGLPPPRLRVWRFSTERLRRRDAAAMQRILRGLHTASPACDGAGRPDMAVLDGSLDGVMGAAYLLWSLGITPFALGDDGGLPVVEARTSFGDWIAGAHGAPIGRAPPDPLLRKVNLTRDRLEDRWLEGAIATEELTYISSILEAKG